MSARSSRSSCLNASNRAPGSAPSALLTFEIFPSLVKTSRGFSWASALGPRNSRRSQPSWHSAASNSPSSAAGRQDRVLPHARSGTPQFAATPPRAPPLRSRPYLGPASALRKNHRTYASSVARTMSLSQSARGRLTQGPEFKLGVRPTRPLSHRRHLLPVHDH